jgi:hypothetical protein
MADIFISFAREDQPSAKVLAEAPTHQGWLVWWDHEIPPGSTFDEMIEKELSEVRCVLALWSAASVASKWVKAEAAEANDRGVLVPVLLEDVRLPLEFRRIEAADLIGWTGQTNHDGFRGLVKALDGKLRVPAPVRNETKASPRAGERDPRRETRRRSPGDPWSRPSPARRFSSARAGGIS